MALADYATYKRKVEGSQFRGLFTKNSVTMISGTLAYYTSFTTAPDAGAAPGTTPRQCGRATAGNLLADQRNDLGLNTAPIFVTDIEVMQPANQSRPVAPVLMVDRLADVSGLSATVITAQTITGGLIPNRNTNGQGVMAAVQIYTAIGSTATTLTISYTNQSGVAGQVSKAIVFGGTTAREVAQVLPIPLADGDSGIQSVQSVTVLASTATAGNFGITLYRPVAVMPNSMLNGPSGYRDLLSAGAMCEISDDACLELWYNGLAATSSGIHTGRINIIRGD